MGCNTMLHQLHVIDFYWDEFKPVINCYESATARVVQITLMPTTELNMHVGSKKLCIGKYELSTYTVCPEQREVSEYLQCSYCAKSMIPQLACIFEPRCNGELCNGASFCKTPHIVYLAYFRNKVKIGMTRADRLLPRVIEQGADAYCVVEKVNTRRLARKLEQKLSRLFNLRQSYPNTTILKTFSEPLNVTRVREKFDDLARALENTLGRQLGELQFVEHYYPIQLPLRAKPRLRKTVSVHQGKVVGIKGKFLIYDKYGLNALNLDELVARKIFIGGEHTNKEWLEILDFEGILPTGKNLAED
jgi:hypothetical protein